jgi:hypothetical protein
MCLATALQASPVVTTNSVGSLILTNHFGDLNDDGQVDVRDIVLLSHHLNGTRLLSAPMLARADLNQDGKVDDTDRHILADMIARRNTGTNDDFDGDELANADEMRLGTNPFDPDTDHDGWLDGWEVFEGTDPLSAQSFPKTLVVAGPPVTVLSPLLQDSDTNMLGIVVARPPVQVLSPLMQDSDTNMLGTVLARPPVDIFLPVPEALEEAGRLTAAQPPVEVVYPLLQNGDTNSYGALLALPPVEVVYPLLQNEDTNWLGVLLARPPVTITNFAK